MMNISQEYVAKHLGISQAAYSNIEGGKTMVSMDKLFRIAHALDVKAEAILKFDPRIALDACEKLNNDPFVVGAAGSRNKKKRKKKMSAKKVSKFRFANL